MDIFDQLTLDEAPTKKKDIFDDLSLPEETPAASAPVVTTPDTSGLANVTDTPTDPIPEADPQKLRSEAFKMLNDSGRTSVSVQRDVADPESGVTGTAIKAGKNLIGNIGEAAGALLTSAKGKLGMGGSNPEDQVLMNDVLQNADDLKAARDRSPKDSTEHKLLDSFVKYFEGNGVTDGTKMLSTLKDSIKENVWDSTTNDDTRVLSDGSVRVNPKFVALPTPDEGIAAIKAATPDPELQAQEISNFQESRKRAAELFDKKARDYDADYRAHAAKQAAAGVTDPEMVFYSWDGLDRNWIEKSWDVVRDVTAETGRGLYRTSAGISMGIRNAGHMVGIDSDAGLAEDARKILASSEKSGYASEIAAARGESGPVTGAAKDLGTSLGEMAPMFAGGSVGRAIGGGAEATAAQQLLGKGVIGTSIYGWAGAQGYGSLMQSALEAARDKAEAEGRDVSDSELVSAIKDHQGAALANGFQTAILSKLLPQGAEAAAAKGLAAEAGQLTGREVLESFAQKYGKDGVRAAVMGLKPELVTFAKQAYKAAKVGFKDEALEEGVNQFLEGAITKMSGADSSKTWDQIGQESWQGTWQGGFIGSALPVATKVLGNEEPEVRDAKLTVAANADAAPEAAAAAMAALNSAPESEHLKANKDTEKKIKTPATDPTASVLDANGVPLNVVDPGTGLVLDAKAQEALSQIQEPTITNENTPTPDLGADGTPVAPVGETPTILQKGLTPSSAKASSPANEPTIDNRAGSLDQTDSSREGLQNDVTPLRAEEASPSGVLPRSRQGSGDVQSPETQRINSRLAEILGSGDPSFRGTLVPLSGKPNRVAYRDSRAKSEADAKEAILATKGKFTKADGSSVVITPSSKKGVILQVTYFDPSGNPVSDTVLHEEDDIDAFLAEVAPDVAEYAMRNDLREAGVLGGINLAIPSRDKPVAYQYRLKYRDVGPASQPDGFISSAGRNVEYDRPLTEQELADFEIEPTGARLLTPPTPPIAPNEQNTQGLEEPSAETAQPTPADTGAPGGAGDGGTAAEAQTTEPRVSILQQVGEFDPEFPTRSVMPDGTVIDLTPQPDGSAKLAIVVPEPLRNNPDARVGSAAVQKVVDLAQAQGLPLTLDVMPLGNDPSKTMTAEELTRWYAKFGFVDNGDGTMTLPAKESDEDRHARRLEEFDALPPIPEDHIRLMHQTSVGNAEDIRANGLSYGSSLNSTTHSFSDPAQARDIINSDYTNGGSKGVTLFFDVPVDEHNRHSSRREFTGQAPPGVLPASYLAGAIGEPITSTAPDPQLSAAENPPDLETLGDPEALTPPVEKPEVIAGTHAVSDAERERLGMKPRMPQPKWTEAGAWDAAVATADADPQAGSKLLDYNLAEQKFTLTPEEHALMVHEMGVRKLDTDRAYAEFNALPDNVSPAVLDAALNRATAAQAHYDTLMDYMDAVGSVAGSGLKARQTSIMFLRDFSVSSLMNISNSTINKGARTKRKLSAERRDKIIAISEKESQLKSRLESLLSENQEQASLIEQLTADVERSQKKGEARDLKTKSRIKKLLDPRAAAARERIQERKSSQESRLYSGGDPQDILDAGIIGASLLVDKTLDLAEFANRMVRDLGDWVTEHIEAIFGKARQIYNETEASVKGVEAPSPADVLSTLDGTTPLDKSDVWALARAHVITGKRGTNVLDAVFSDLSAKYPSLTREEVAVLFTDYGKVSYPSTNETSVQLRKIRTMERLQEHILRLKRGEAPLGTGLRRDKPDVEIRQLEKQYRQLAKEVGVSTVDPERQLQSALASAKTRMQNEIDELQAAIDSGERNVSKRKGVEYDEDAKKLKESLVRKRAEYASVFGVTAEDVARMKRDAAQRTLTAWTDRLAESQSDTPPAQKKPAPVEPMRKLITDHLKSENPDFVSQAVALGVSQNEAETLDAILAKERKIITEISTARDTEAKTQEARAARAIKALDRQIAEEDAMLRDGVLKRPKNEPIRETPEIAEKRRLLAEKRQTRRDLYEAQNPGESALQQAKNAVTRSIERLTKIRESGVIAIREKKQINPDAELSAMLELRDSLSDEVRELRRAMPLTPAKQARQIEIAVKAAQTTLDRIQERLDTNDLSIPVKTETAASRNAAVVDLRSRIKAANQELAKRRRDAKPKLSPEEARTNRQLASLTKRSEELQRRLREKDVSRKPKPDPVHDPRVRKAQYDYEKLKASFSDLQGELALENATPMQKAKYYLMGTANAMKVITLGGDVGVIFRQLGTTYQALAKDIALVSRATVSGEARQDLKQRGSSLGRLLKTGAMTLFDESIETSKYEEIMNRPGAEFDKADGMYFAPPFDAFNVKAEDLPRAEFIQNIPWWIWPALAGVKVAAFGVAPIPAALMIGLGIFTKPMLQKLDRAQRVMTNVARAEFIDAARMGASANGARVLTAGDRKVLATAVMVATGRGKASSVEAAIPVANQFLLATRFYISRIQALSLYPLWSNVNSDATKHSRAQVAKMYGQSLAGRAALYTMLIAMFGRSDDDEDKKNGTVKGMMLNPYSSDFGRLKLSENLKIDFMSGINGFASISARYLGKRRLETKGGSPSYTALGPGYANNVNDEAMRFIGTKFNLLFSLVKNTHAGAYYGGKPATTMNFIDQATTMIMTNDIVRIFQELGPVKGAVVATLMLGGAGTSIRPTETEQSQLDAQKKLLNKEMKSRQRELNEP